MKLAERNHGRSDASGSRVAARAAVVLSLMTFLPRLVGQDAASSSLVWPRVSGNAEVSVANRYIYHGYVAEDDGPVVQPYFELFGEFFQSNALLTSASFRLSVFNSFQTHDNHLSRKAEPMRSWYEAQIEPGVELIFAEKLTLTASYRRFESPNGAYGASNGFELAVAYDDGSLLRAFALHPHALWITPFANDGNPEAERGNYFEAGIGPRVTLNEHSRYPVTLTLPTDLGWGDTRYYAGRRLGFFSVGLTAAVPLAFIPQAYGRWTLGASGQLFYLGKTPAEFTNSGDRKTFVASGFLSTDF